MLSIDINSKISRDYPESIAEMTSDQFVNFADLVFMYQSKQISYQEFSVRLTYTLLNMERTVKKTNKSRLSEVSECINYIAKNNDAFFEEKHKEGKTYKVIALNFVSNLIPKIKVGDQWYYGPSDALTNTEFGEYVSALNFYIDFSKSNKVEDLDLLVGVLYRPENESKSLNDKRTPFNKELISYYAKEVSTIPFAEKYAIYLFFAACQQFIVTTKELSLSGGITVDLSVLFNQSKTNEKGIGMAGIIYSLAESNVFGDAEKTAKQPTYEILLRMVQTYYQAKKLERDAKN